MSALLRIRDYGDTTFVTGMRAYAALAVVLIHAGGAGLRAWGPLGEAIVDYGRAGVVVFYVISGFSVSAQLRGEVSYGAYLLRRFLRLAPLYYAWLLVAVLTLRGQGYWARFFAAELDLRNILYHLLFVHGFDHRLTNSIIGVEWSMSVEMFWYLLIPALWSAARRGWGGVIAAAGLIWHLFLVWVSMELKPQMPGVDLLVLWSPLSYLFCFSMGVWAFHVRSKLAASSAARRTGLWTALGLQLLYFLAAARVWGLSRVPDMQVVAATATSLFLVFGSGKDLLCRALFLSPFALTAGTLSYGVYLSHVPVMTWLEQLPAFSTVPMLLRFCAVAAGALLVSALGFRYLEEPVMRWSRLIGRGSEQNRNAS